MESNSSACPRCNLPVKEGSECRSCHVAYQRAAVITFVVSLVAFVAVLLSLPAFLTLNGDVWWYIGLALAAVFAAAAGIRRVFVPVFACGILLAGKGADMASRGLQGATLVALTGALLVFIPLALGRRVSWWPRSWFRRGPTP